MLAFKYTLPDNQSPPTLLLKCSELPLVTRLITFKLLLPPLCSRGWPFKQRTSMQVPEAAMNEYDCFVFLQHQVRFAGKIPIVQAITIATSEQLLAEQHFRPSVFATDRRHITATGGFIMNVSHLPNRIFGELSRHNKGKTCHPHDTVYINSTNPLFRMCQLSGRMSHD